MKKLRNGFIVVLLGLVSWVKPMMADSKMAEAPGTILGEYFENLVVSLQGVLKCREGMELPPDERKEIETAIKEIRRFREDKLVNRPPTPKEIGAELVALKKMPEYAKLSQKEKDDIENALRYLRDPSRRLESDLPATMSQEKADMPPNHTRRLNQSSSNRVTRIRFVPGK